MGSTEDVWSVVLPQQARVRYTPPKLVLYTGQISSACGYAEAAMGPFYCPGDQKLYLDFAFFQELKNEFKAPGDFAQAYVIAHEVGHHVQNLLGTMDKVQGAGNSNRLSVALELQADCYAGVWGNYAAKKGSCRTGRPGRSDPRRSGRGRRHDPKTHPRLCCSRFIHARLGPAADGLVRPRI